MPLETNFNAAPYFDDYDANNNFYRVLFKPGTAVQARELTQLQTILQDQIEKFGRHVFKEGSVVEGCTLNFDPNYKFVKVRDVNSNGVVINVNDFVGDKLVSAANLQAVVVKAINGLESNNPDLNTLYVKYLNSATYANGSQQRTFDPGETLTVRTIDDVDLDSISVANSTFNPIGTGYAVSISEGVIFSKGFFIRIEPQTIVISKYDTNPTNLSVGFYTNETITTSDSDSSLFDNAIGSPNFNAPGANRLKLVSELVTRATDTINSTANSTNFFSIVDFNSGVPITRLTDPAYARLGAEIARRTFEESGDYVVDPFELSTSANTTNPNNVVLEIGSGIGYVKGFRVEYIDVNRVDLRKGTDTAYFPNQIITTGYGSYTFVNELAGPFDTINLDEVGLYATAATRLTSGNYTTGGAAPSTQIGTAKVRGIEYFSGIPGTPTCQYKLYLFDVRITAGGRSFADVRSIYATDTAGVASYADTVLSGGVAVLRETATPDLVFPLGRSAAKTVNTTSTSFFYRTKTTRTFQANGTATLVPPTSHPGGIDTIAVTGSLSESNESRFIVIANTSANAVNISSITVSVNTTSTNVTGNGAFTSNFAVGDYISVGNSSTSAVRRVTEITNSTVLVVNSSFSFTNSAVNICRHFPAGVPISFAREDSANVSVALDGSSATFNLGTNLASTFVASIYYDVFRDQAVQAAKVVNKNRFVKIEANTHPTRNQGPWCLGLSNAIKLRGVYQGTTYSNTNPNFVSSFVLDSGQTSGYYGLSYISIRPGSGHTVGANDRLLIEVDHLTPDYSGGIGYFSINSYPIDDANTANSTAIATPEIPLFTSPTGGVYDLRDCVDFRAYANNTANSATTVADATTNPSETVTIYVDPSGSYVPTNDQNFNTAFTYYLGRRSKVALSVDGVINIIDGAPDIYPSSPRDLDGMMTLGLLSIPPYPSLSQDGVRLYGRPDYGITTSLVQNRRYTMRDIGVIDKKLARLEYYTSLSLLENSARTLIVRDDVGAERFKNGFIVDSFKGFSIADTTSPEFKAAVDIKMHELAPRIKRAYIDLDFNTSLSTGVTKEGNLVMLTGNTVVMTEQPFASKVRNCVENIIYVWTGNIQLSPEGDHQPDLFRNPDVVASVDLSPITNFINAMPNIIGPERIVSTTAVAASTRAGTTRTQREFVNAGRDADTGRPIRDVIETTIASFITDTTTTTTTTTLRNEFDASATNVDNSFDFGEVVQDVSFQQFIRPRRITFTAVNLKPNTTVFPFFDGRLVSVHCTQTNSSFVATKGKGDSLVTDGTGTLYGYFDIPAETFKVGDRIFRLIDVDDLTIASNIITTEAIATYSASNISITKARLGLNTRVPQPSWTSTERVVGTATTASRNSSVVTNRVSQVVRTEVWDPISQTFLVNEDSAGIFLKKLDLYFRNKHPTLGVEVQIREVENGFPTTRIVPFGRKVLTSAQVNVSNDASVATSFEFDTPVFLQSQIEYCFVVMPIGSNDGYNIWVGEIGGTDVTTGNPIYENNSTGVMFTSSTNRVWTPFQKEDIKFVLHRKNFTSLSGNVVYTNSNTEYLTANNFRGSGFTVGEKVYVSNGTAIILSNAAANGTNTISVIANGTSNAQSLFTNGSYVYISSNTGSITELKLITSIPNTTHIVVDSNVSFTDSNSSVGALRANGELFGYVSVLSDTDGLMYLERSSANTTSNFTNVVTATANSLVIGEESKSRANLVSVDSVVYSTVMPQFSFVSPEQTRLSILVKGSNSTSTDASYTQMNSDIETFFTDRERTVRSRSLELQGGGSKSIEVSIPMVSTNSRVSPFVDDIKSNVLVFENLLNASFEIGDETLPFGANAAAKYISKKVVLAEDQDAEDIQVYLSAYKPANSDIKVYVKFLNREDSDSLNEKAWTPLNQNTAASVVSSRIARNDLREFLYDTPFRYSVNASSTTAMADYAVYGTFSNTNISSNTITVANANPLPIGSLVYYIGDVASITNGFFSVLTANTTAIKLAVAGTETEVSITPASSANTGTLYFIPQTAFRDRYQSNVISYHSSTGALFSTYKTFSIKIVMTSDEGSHLSPRVSDMRAIALQA